MQEPIHNMALHSQATAWHWRAHKNVAVLEVAYMSLLLVSRLLQFVPLCSMQGHVVECGTHNALLSQGGKYAKMWARQANVDDMASVGSE